MLQKFQSVVFLMKVLHILQAIQQILLKLVIQFQKIQHILKEMFQLNGLMKMGLMLVTVILTHLLFLLLRMVLRFTDIKLL